MWGFIAAGASLLGGIAGGKDAQRQAYRQAALDEFEARGAEEEGQANARKVYANAVAVKGQQVAQLAASGVVIGDGSAQAVVEETDKLARQDAMAVIYTANRQAASLRGGASARKQAGDSALLTGITKGVTGAISSYASYSAKAKKE